MKTNKIKPVKTKANAMESMEINKSQLKELIGEIVPFGYQAKLNENVFTTYLDNGEDNGQNTPILIRSKYTKAEFDNLFR